MSLKYDENFYNRVATENEHELNCSVPFHSPAIKDKTGRNITICGSVDSGRKAFDRYIRYYNSRILSLDNKPCSRFDVSLGLPDINEGGDPNAAFVRLYMAFEIKVKRIVAYYDSTTLAAEIGGYIGMLLGFSLVDLVVLSSSGIMKLFQSDFLKNGVFRRNN